MDTTAEKSKESIKLTQELLAAVDEGELATVVKLLKNPELSVNVTNKHGESPLHIAAGYGRLKIVQLLRSHGATTDIKDKQGDTPLYWAARHGHLSVVKYLCEQGAAITKDLAGETPLHVSARYGHPDVLSYFCRNGAQMDITDNEGDTPLLCGCWHGYQSVVECLVEAGCSLQVSNKEGETALHVAAVRGYYTIVRFLCGKGANMDAQDKTGCTPLHLATRRNHHDTVQYLCEQGCNVNLQDNNGDTALHDACREGQLSIFYTLFAFKCGLDISNKNGATPLHLASKYGHVELVRQLCVSGCDVNAVTEHGFTADEVAANSSHDELATLIHALRQDDLRHQYISELKLGQVPVDRVKLFVCGAAGVGKTELVDSLKCHLLRSLFRKRSPSSLTQMILKRTYGMTVQQVTVPNAGNFSIWDFSGMREYYVTHEQFLMMRNSIALVVFSLRDSLEKQLAQVRFWLAMIKSRQPPPANEVIRFAGENPSKPHVVLVGSFADQQHQQLLLSQRQLPTLGQASLRLTASGPGGAEEDIFAVPLASSVLEQQRRETEGEEGEGERKETPPDNATMVLRTMKEEFGRHFEFHKHVFELDCRLSQTAAMKSLRQHLNVLSSRILKPQPYFPPLVRILVEYLPEWREEHSDMPVVTLEFFHNKTREQINPLVSEDRMKMCVSALHDMGEMFFLDEYSKIVVLDPSWLGTQVFGPALSPENSIIPQLKSITGCVKLDTVQKVYPKLDATSIAHLLEHFQLCTPLDGSRTNYLFPCLVKMQPLFGLWVKDPSFVVYAGVRLACSSEVDIFSPNCFPQVALSARRVFFDDIDDQELTLWSNGFKCCRGEVEIQVKQVTPHKMIEILVRGTQDARPECYGLLQQFYAITVDTIRNINPGTHFTTSVLSPKLLQDHREPPISYSAVDIFEAERRSDGILCHAPQASDSMSPGGSEGEESILDVICCGCQDQLIIAKSAPFSSISNLPLLTRIELSRLLDPPHPFGRDWCLLALQLEMTDEVQQIHEGKGHASPTNQLLTVWEKSVNSTVVTVIDALRSIGREDAAKVVIEGLNLFSNTSSSVVISIPGVPITSYVC